MQFSQGSHFIFKARVTHSLTLSHTHTEKEKPSMPWVHSTCANRQDQAKTNTGARNFI